MRVEDSHVSLGGEVQSLEFSFQRRSITFIREEPRKNPFGVIPIRVKMQPIQVDSVEDAKELIVKKLIELLTGKKVKTLSIEDLTSTELPPVNEPQFGAVYEEENVSVKANRLNFFAYGEVRTKDGRVFRFEVNFKLFNMELKVSDKTVRSGSVALVDPLIIDLNGSPELLSPARFEFDINGDGKKEKVPLLAEGKGFIFFDRNSNNRVDRGEIVGVRTGDAFSELSSLDSDGNGWPDEGDPAFSRLKVLLRNAREDRVVSLSQLGVGALYTGSFKTVFNLGSTGVLKNLGLYLTESGNSGVLAKVDFRA